MAPVIRHAIFEGILLLRGRTWATLSLAIALAVPVAVGGTALTFGLWAAPLLRGSGGAVTVEVLLRPQRAAPEVDAWLKAQRRKHPDWRIRVVPAADLSRRLSRWFPYLRPLLEAEGTGFVPSLVEVTTARPEAVNALKRDSGVLAVGPTTSLHRSLERTSARLRWLVGITTAILLLSAGLLAGIWIHLELYRHADEIAIMRLVGATESTVRGPFLFAVLVTGTVSGISACGMNLLFARWLSGLLLSLGLPAIRTSWAVLALQILVAVGVPLLVATITLARHAALEIES